MKKIIITAFSISLLSYASTASAGCPIQVEFINKMNSPVIVHKEQSKVRSQVPGSPLQFLPWKRFMGSDVHLAANTSKTKSYSLSLGCAAGVRKFKFNVTSTNNISFWEQKKLVPMVDKKLKLKIKR